MNKTIYISLLLLITFCFTACQDSPSSRESERRKKAKENKKEATNAIPEDKPNEVIVGEPASSSNSANYIVEMLNAVNKVRAKGCKCGRKKYPSVGALKLSKTLEDVALGHSKEMEKYDYMAHKNKAGKEVADRVKDKGYTWMTVGENVASGQTSVAEVMEDWLKSKGHCQNIMNGDFTEFGAEKSGTYWTQVFATPRETMSNYESENYVVVMLEAVNKVRAEGCKCGRRKYPSVGALKLNKTLQDVALGHSQEMEKHEYLAHENRRGEQVADRVTKRGYTWMTVGENIANGQLTVDEVMKGWIASKGHCKNIMNGDFKEFGAEKSGVYWTQVFATKMK